MSSQAYKLPIEQRTFKTAASNVFSLSDESLSLLFREFNKKKTSFSTATISKLLTLDAAKASSIRELLLYMIHMITRHELTSETVVKELGEIGCEEKKIVLFMDNVKGLDKETIDACNILYDVTRYMLGVQHLESSTVEVSYATLYEEKDKPFLMFPLLRVTLVVHGEEESKEISFAMDPDGFQTLISNLQRNIETLLREAETLKRSLGDKYMRVIGD